MNILDYAIKIELDGVGFYNDLALTAEGSGLNKICLSLAQDEENHARILKNKKDNIKAPLEERPALRTENIFSTPVDFGIDKNYQAQIDLYKLALDKEQQSIDLYNKLLYEMQEDKELFEFLIKQEQEHYRIISDILTMINRPNEWVESAEFGIREEY